jgi:clan AA aspartic protease
MICGTVNARNEITLSLPVCDSVGAEHIFQVMLDTGFAGTLSLPTPVISALGLAWKSKTTFGLANGQYHAFDNYAATILWDGKPLNTMIQAIDNVPLLGTALLTGHELRVRFVDGGNAEIELVP